MEGWTNPKEKPFSDSLFDYSIIPRIGSSFNVHRISNGFGSSFIV